MIPTGPGSAWRLPERLLLSGGVMEHVIMTASRLTTACGIMISNEIFEEFVSI